MPSPDDTLERIRSGDADALEDEWLSHLDEDPTDVEYFVATARAAAGSVDEELLRSLLRLLEEELVERSAWGPRLELLNAVGGLFLRPNPLHAATLESARELYSESDNLDEMVRIAGLHQVTQSERELARQVERLHSLMELDVGRLVHMDGKGVGRITDINFELGSYKIDFEQHTDLTVGFRAGAKLLEPVPDGHILRSKIEEPERLHRLRDEDPSELLREVLESYPHPLTAAEVRRALAGVVSSSEWTRWWNNARNSPQVVVSTDKRQRYSWAATSDDAAREVWASFDSADLDEQLAIFAKNARQNEEVAERMAAVLARTAEERMKADPASALEMWHVLSRAGMADDEAAYSPGAIVEGADGGLIDLTSRLDQRPLRELLYREIRRRKSGWVEILERCLYAEPEPGLAGVVGEWIREADADRYLRIVDRVIGHPSEHPGAFVWVVQAARDDDALRRRSPLRLFRQLLVAASSAELSPYRATLEPLLEAGGTLAKLVGELEEEEAEAASTAVKRAVLPDYRRAALITALETRFPTLRADADSEALYATRRSIEARREELRQLREVEIPAARDAVQEAAALGDLRENFEYKSARQRFEYLSARVSSLTADLDRVRVLDLEHLDTSEVRIGVRVELGRDGERRQLTILGPWESAPEKGIISYQSELGAALLGKKAGDTVGLGEGEYTVVDIDRWHDD